MAPIVDLAATYSSGADGNAVAELLGGSPSEQPARFGAAAPLHLLPLRIPQLILHGSADDVLPVEGARSYARAAAAAGDPVRFVELPKAGHMDYLDPGSEAHQALCAWLERLEVGSPAPPSRGRIV